MKNFFVRAILIFLFLAPVSALADVGQPISSVSGVTPVDCSGTIASGTTAQTAIAASPGLHGFIIANIDATEALWVSFTGTAAVATSGSFPIAAGTALTFANSGTFASPIGAGFNTNVSVNATTSAHKFTCVKW